jgi:hypothetical protein
MLACAGSPEMFRGTGCSSPRIVTASVTRGLPRALRAETLSQLTTTTHDSILANSYLALTTENHEVLIESSVGQF